MDARRARTVMTELPPSMDQPSNQPSNQRPPAPKSRLGLQQLPVFISLAQSLWKRWEHVVKPVRSQLPKAIQAYVSEQVLAAALLGSLVVILIALTGGHPDASRATAIQAPLASSDPEPEAVLAPAALESAPDLALIASIQDQVAAITDRYTTGLIQAVQANFNQSQLAVTVGSGWNDLVRSQQDQLANDVFERAQSLDFATLTLVTPDGGLLARSPVVGTEMVVLQRHANITPTALPPAAALSNLAPESESPSEPESPSEIDPGQPAVESDPHPPQISPLITE